MRIAVIGPSYPFRGGISHYTTCLCKSLEKNKHIVKLFSFLRLYPSIIFPGTSQKDEKSEKKVFFKSRNTIDSINPFTWYSTFKEIKKFNPSIVIFQWWTPIFFPVYSLLSFLIKNNTKAKVLFLCHNVHPHEKILSNRLILKVAFRYGDFFIAHSEGEKKEILKLTGKKKVKFSLHPTYGHFKYKSISSKVARKQLNLKSKIIILFFGYVKKYKGLIYLIKALKYIPKFFDYKLLVVGEFYEKKEKYVDEIKKLGLKDKVIIVDIYVPNESVGLYFSASDVIVCPYVSATQSGIVQITYAFNKPVISSRVGGLPDVIDDGKTGYLVERCNPKALADAIVKFFKNKDKIDFKKNIQNIQDRFSWDHMVKTIESFMK